MKKNTVIYLVAGIVALIIQCKWRARKNSRNKKKKRYK